MKTVRNSVFETNSSSVHSLTLCSKDEQKAWQKGELVFWQAHDKLCKVEDLPESIRGLDKKKWPKHEVYTWDQWDTFVNKNNEYYRMEFFEKEQTLPNGEIVVAFGYHGFDR